MKNVERTVAVRDGRDQYIRGRVSTHALNQPVGGNYIARVEHSDSERAVATVKYNRALEWLCALA
jgi:hypothetical protein